MWFPRFLGDWVRASKVCFSFAVAFSATRGANETSSTAKSIVSASRKDMRLILRMRVGGMRFFWDVITRAEAICGDSIGEKRYICVRRYINCKCQ